MRAGPFVVGAALLGSTCVILLFVFGERVVARGGGGGGG